jgi:hypothetical protein
VFDRLLRKYDLTDRAQIALVCGLVDVAKKYVTMGIGIALMYVTVGVTQTTRGLQLRALDDEIERLPTEMAVRKGTHLPKYVDLFRQNVRRFVSEKHR